MSEQDQIELKARPQPQAAPALAPTQEDAGSQALSEALRSSFFIVKLVMAGLVAVFLASGFFIVDARERAIILRFGKPLGKGEQALLGPGPHFAFPRPIDEIVRVPITTQQSADSTIGWYATTPELEASKSEPPPGPMLNPAFDGYTLTSDRNIIHVRATVRYHITDPIQFHFTFPNARNFVTNALDNALVYASAQFTVDDVLTRNVSRFKETVTARLADLIREQNLGIAIEQLDVTQTIPPRQLQAKFSEVLQASIKRDDARNKAESYNSETLSKARAEAEARINTAQTERARLVGLVAAEAKKFSDLLPQYEANPELFIRVRQTETLEKVMANAREKIFWPSRADGKTRELRLQLNREPLKPQADK